MTSTFEGVRVLEVAEWTLVPAAGAVLAQFGADVIKVERPMGGDAQRGLAVSGVTPLLNGVGLQVEQTNLGGKRSIGIDITNVEGQALIRKLIGESDVFLTSLLPATRKRVGLDIDDVRTLNPRIIYAYGNGLGAEGPDSEKGGYDMTAYWCRSGLAYSLSDPIYPPVQMRPGIGDRIGAMNIVAGIAAALFRRERTGEGATVEVSLLGTAMWQLASDIVYSNALEVENSRVSRGRNPLTGYYETSDERWLALALLESDRWWPRFVESTGMQHLLADPRFEDSYARQTNYEACVELIAAEFRKRTLDEWRKQMSSFPGPWSPIQSVQEILKDPQVTQNNYITEIETVSGQPVGVVPAPFRIDGQQGRLDPCPEAGAQTEEVLLEFGESWDEIIRLKDCGAIC